MMSSIALIDLEDERSKLAEQLEIIDLKISIEEAEEELIEQQIEAGRLETRVPELSQELSHFREVHSSLRLYYDESMAQWHIKFKDNEAMKRTIAAPQEQLAMEETEKQLFVERVNLSEIQIKLIGLREKIDGIEASIDTVQQAWEVTFVSENNIDNLKTALKEAEFDWVCKWAMDEKDEKFEVGDEGSPGRMAALRSASLSI